MFEIQKKANQKYTKKRHDLLQSNQLAVYRSQQKIQLFLHKLVRELPGPFRSSFCQTDQNGPTVPRKQVLHQAGVSYSFLLLICLKGHLI